jgi:hypothetical protein
LQFDTIDSVVGRRHFWTAVMHHRFSLFTAAQTLSAMCRRFLTYNPERKAATPRIENLKATMHRRTPELALSD